MTHLVERIGFDFQMENEHFARQLYAGWDVFFRETVGKILEDVLEKYEVTGTYLNIGRIELELRTFSESRFYDEFPLHFREGLEEYLAGYIGNAAQDRKKRVPEEEYALDLLLGFLLRGTLSADRLGRYGGSLQSLFLYVAGSTGEALARALRTYGHYTGLQERLIHQLDDPELEAGINLLAPADGGFICSYVRLVRSKYGTIEQPGLTPQRHRHAVWTVVYGYLLNDRGTVFNRKAFLSGTVTVLAGAFGMAYGDLIRILTEEIGRIRDRTDALPELLLLLEEIRQDAARRERDSLILDTAALYRMIASVIQRGEMAIRSEWFQPMRWILMRETASEILFRMLREQEIRSLVPLVAPGERPLVSSYADMLEVEYRRGSFEGKAGSGFSRIKWVVIFSVLLENHGAELNRSHFVERVLARLAGRYNLTLYDLLDYLLQENALQAADPQLAAILRSLGQKYGEAPAEESKRAKDRIEQIAAWLLKPRKKTDKALREEWMGWFTRHDFREQWLNAGTESDCCRLMLLLFPKEGVFLSEYAGQLEAVRKDFSLEGRASGGFSRVKWEFILRAVMEPAGGNLNRKYIIQRVLTGIAARYNLGYTELLFYFTSRAGQLPVSLKAIMDELLAEEWRRTGRSTDPAVWRRVWKQLPPAYRCWARDMEEGVEVFVRLLPMRNGIGEGELRDIFRRILPELLYSRSSTPNGTVDWDSFMRLVIRRFAVSCRTRPEEIAFRWLQSLRSGSRPRNKHLVPLLEKIMEAERPATSRVKNKDITINPLKSEIMKEENQNPETLYVNNAGIVLLNPFIPRIFQLLDYLEDGKFRNDETRIRAMFVLQFAAFGQTEFPEHELTLNKILTGASTSLPLPRSLELTGKEKQLTGEMLQGSLQHWEKMKHTSVNALQQAFLQRPGSLTIAVDRIDLTVEEKAYDLLLDTVPWNFRMIRFRWMETPLFVKWRG